MKVLLPSTVSSESFTGGAGDDFIVYDVHAPIPEEHRDAEVLVAWQNPPAQLAAAAQHLTRLRLVQALASGTDAVTAAGFPESVQVCSGRSLHDGPVAEHTLALLLACVRRLDRLYLAQQSRTWDNEYLHDQASPDSAGDYTLNGARVLVWGFGSIAAKLAPLLTSLGAKVTGVASTAGNRAGYPVVTEDTAREMLASTNVLISLVPATARTDKLFNNSVFAAMPPGSVFINTGRGSTVDEADLISAIEKNHLRVAAIDVAQSEPLPSTSPLWRTENLIITPHVSGNRPQGAAALIGRNLKALHAGSMLENLTSKSVA
ncbi:NAD(P)-dependent oxidoreductase [Pseudarthrobacter sp. GA104]|uniref:NAD(P)-dependent oxidoreductase n=1 Tax=Pseudarthrobacter sp. GA104 TaxID=2676311 RepID=UPI0012FA7EEC|nr:NAD(P)-dependent oxidoreductase [Pseudarthrobacter sp. GA104]MUU69771.1 phosphoglycerate dehydrogenase [Pseudarthrobacter sp. GA104]